MKCIRCVSRANYDMLLATMKNMKLPATPRVGHLSQTVHKAVYNADALYSNPSRPSQKSKVTEMIFWRVALSVVCIALGYGAIANKNFDVHIDKLERVGDTGEYFTYNYTYEKVSDMKFSMGAHVQQLKELDDSYTVKALMTRSELADGSQYEVMMDLEKTLCDWMRTIYKAYFYEELAQVSNFPHYDTCPLPVAEYVVENYVFDTEPYSEMMSEGRWKVEMMLMKEGKVCSGIVMITTVKPKA